MSDIDKLANDISVVLLAEWLAIEAGETRLQAGAYVGKAQELRDYLIVIGFRLEEEIRKQESEAVIRCITDAKRVHPDWGIDDIIELLNFREETMEALKNQSGNFISLEEIRQALKEEK